MPSACTACCSSDLSRVESVSIDYLARAWASEKSHGAQTGFQTIRRRIACDLDAAQVEFWQCAACELEMGEPMKSWTAAHYPKESQGPGFDHTLALDELARTAPCRVLEIGCAEGGFLRRAEAFGHKATGIDFFEEAVASASASGLDARVADVKDLARLFADARFDVIAMFQIIEHLTDSNEIFSDLGKIAARDAVLMIGCPSDLRYTRHFNHSQRLGRSDFWDYPPQHTLRWNPKSLRLFLSRHGWEIETIAYEPLAVLAAAAHMTALNGVGLGWYKNRVARRAETLRWCFKIAARSRSSRLTGIRLFIKARRAR